MPKELIYPHFINCVEFIEDEFWKNIFEDLTFGETPNGCYISKKHLQSTVKGREFIYKIKPDDDPFVVYTTLIDIFTNRMKIVSPTDVEISRQSINDDECDTWSSIKKKSIKDIIITNFVIDMTNKYDIPKKKSKILLDMITLFMSLKIIGNNDINYNDGKITSINGLVYDEKRNTFKMDKNIEVECTAAELNEDNKQMVDEWKKLLKDLDKLTNV